MATGYLERTDEKLALQLDNFASKLNNYAGQFGLTTPEADGIVDDAAYFSWMTQSYRKVESHKKEWTLLVLC